MRRTFISNYSTVWATVIVVLFRADYAAAQKYDLVITGGTIIDGSSSKGFPGSIAIKGSKIVLVSREPIVASESKRVIQANGKVIAPGFIDLHAHLDPLFTLPDCQSHVRQGVTTALGGPDGGSPWPLRVYTDSLEKIGVGMNVAFLVGHNTIRNRVMGMSDRKPTPQEQTKMQELVAQGMREGAYGLSTGLKYLPGAFSTIDEVIGLSLVASRMGGIYTSHLREEGLGLIEAVAEAIEIGRRAKIPVVLTHHKVVGKPMWGASVRTLAMVDSARASGIDVMIDQYPYTASYTGISVLIPAWALAGGDSLFRRRVQNPSTLDSIQKGIIENILNDRGGGDLRRVQFARVSWMRELEGKTLYDWTVMRGLDPQLKNAAALVIEAQLRGGASAIYHVMDDGDVDRIMKHPYTMIASDGRLVKPGDGHPHPRWYGTFPRVLGHYVREKNVLELEEAVRKMTGLPAMRLGLPDRGLLKEGWVADIVVFDPVKVQDLATFEDPHRYPVGIDYVIVNGSVTVYEGEFRDTRAGRVLRYTPRSR
jgi:N-acyl-D-amino-acid deacylase